MKQADAIGRRLVEVLNRALAADANAVTELLSHRVPCTAALADDPDIQVMEDELGLLVGPLGLLNAVVGARADGQGRVHAVLRPDGIISHFELR